jgi:hypothetical protein
MITYTGDFLMFVMYYSYSLAMIDIKKQLLLFMTSNFHLWFLQDCSYLIRTNVMFSRHTIQYNEQKKKDKRTNNDLQNIKQKTKTRTTRTTLKTRNELKCSCPALIVASVMFLSCSNSGIRRITPVTNSVINREMRKRRPDYEYDKRKKFSKYCINQYTICLQCLFLPFF